MNIPFVDLAAQHQELATEIDEALHGVIDSSSFIGGPQVERFEHHFADYCGSRFAVTCGSGTDALKLALMAAGVEAGQEVVTVPNTFIATVEAITAVGAHPVFVDIEGPTYHLSVRHLQKFLEGECRLDLDGHPVNRGSGRRVAALLPVHLYGQTVDLDPILKLARRFQLLVVEDAAQAHGATYSLEGKEGKAGSFGTAGAFSFYPGKNLGALGDGGAVVTQDENRDRWLRVWRDHGQSEKYVHISPDGWNLRLDSLQCAVLDLKLARLDQWNTRRGQAAAWYRERLERDERIVLPVERSGRRHVYHLFVIRVPRRDHIRDGMAEQGIGVGLHYPIPLHLQEAYRHLEYGPGSFPETEEAAASILSLPMFPHLTEGQVDRVCATLKTVLDGL